MGRRNNNELNRKDRAADQAMRSLLGQHDQPRTLAPPPGLATRIVRQMPNVPPHMAHRAARWRIVRRRTAAWASATLLLLLSLTGAWGIFVNSADPARLFGGPETTVGYLILVATLAAKPLIALVGSTSTPVAATGALAVGALVWMWWLLAARAPMAVLVERP